MSSSDWQIRAGAVAPLLAFANQDSRGGESGVIRAIFDHVPTKAGFGVEFGQRAIDSGTLSSIVGERGWGALYMDCEGPPERVVRPQADGRTLTVARERVTPGNINELLCKHGVPHDLDCLVIDIDGVDYWVWEAIESTYAPSLVIIEFNAHIGFGIAATIHADEDWRYRPSTDYGASFAALCGLAERKGYRLIHVHGPWNLYFLRNDIPLSADLCVASRLGERDLELLTDTAGFYDGLCAGKRPSWYGAPTPDVWRAPWQVLVMAHTSKVVDLEGIPIEVLADKNDPSWYLQRKTFEEKASLLYRFIADEGFQNFVDIGANVGFVSIVAKRAAAGLNVVAFEADPRLVSLMRRNFGANGVEGATIVNAIVGARDAASAAFSLNPTSTLDNRVNMDKWPKVCVPMVTVDSVLRRVGAQGRTFFKIDTQGFELHVLSGMERTLAERDDWILKMEFAPNWLTSQGTDPELLLDYLQQRYEFAEYPERISFATSGLDALFTSPVEQKMHRSFLEYVIALDRNRLGWVDLVVRPKRRT
jgi:FkbM family methyltransferase